MSKTDSRGMKVETRCKQCGKVFVKYSYEKIVRCEECRKANRLDEHILCDPQKSKKTGDS
jgi:ribosomal protein L37AE/L43A